MEALSEEAGILRRDGTRQLDAHPCPYQTILSLSITLEQL